MSQPDLSGLSTRWLGKNADQVTDSERDVLAQVHSRRTVSRNLASPESKTPSFGERVADRVASFGGSWPFIGLFGLFLLSWVVLNSSWLMSKPVDPYPFIFLNLLLSMLAAIQAPIIMMSQNRHSKRDRAMAEHDYVVNLKAEIEILELHEKLDQLRSVQQTALEHQQRHLALVEELFKQQGKA